MSVLSDDEIKEIWMELVSYYGDSLPDPIHSPRTFKYYLKLYLHRKNNKKK